MQRTPVDGGGAGKLRPLITCMSLYAEICGNFQVMTRCFDLEESKAPRRVKLALSFFSEQLH